MNELKPCPFCGGTRPVITGADDRVFVMCRDCGARSTPQWQDDGKVVDMQALVERAENAWNRRAKWVY